MFTWVFIASSFSCSNWILASSVTKWQLPYKEQVERTINGKQFNTENSELVLNQAFDEAGALTATKNNGVTNQQ